MDSTGVRIQRSKHSFSLVREVKESWQVHYTYAMLRAHSVRTGNGTVQNASPVRLLCQFRQVRTGPSFFTLFGSYRMLSSRSEAVSLEEHDSSSLLSDGCCVASSVMSDSSMVRIASSVQSAGIAAYLAQNLHTSDFG